VLVDADDGSIDQGVFEIGIAGQYLEKTLEDAFQRPSPEALKHRVPVPEGSPKIAPGAADPSHP
jgi:hypothetical protein